MRTFLRTLLICLLATAAALAQENPPKAAVVPAPDSPLSAWNKVAYGRVKDILLRSAEKVPEENYNFKPTDAVRSFGQIVGHVADAQYLFCSIELGEKEHYGNLVTYMRLKNIVPPTSEPTVQPQPKK